MISVICLHFRFLARCFFLPSNLVHFDILFRKYCFVIKSFARFDFCWMIESVFCCLFFANGLKLNCFSHFHIYPFQFKCFFFFLQFFHLVYFILLRMLNVECWLVGRVISILLIWICIKMSVNDLTFRWMFRVWHSFVSFLRR